ncbi:MAG: hypothetical protein NXY57DRAFT_1045039, partial [Lentinula lateritia]
STEKEQAIQVQRVKEQKEAALRQQQQQGQQQQQSKDTGRRALSSDESTQSKNQSLLWVLSLLGNVFHPAPLFLANQLFPDFSPSSHSHATSVSNSNNSSNKLFSENRRRGHCNMQMQATAPPCMARTRPFPGGYLNIMELRKWGAFQVPTLNFFEKS